MALTSPGVQVSVVDESFYTPAEPGTTPVIFVATAENKTNASGSGVAQGTLSQNAGKPFLLTSQRDLADTFGDPIFQIDSNNNPIHGSELNEYGLLAAYSFLGVSNRAWVVRAPINLNLLRPSSTVPAADPTAGTYWLDSQTSQFGIQEWNSNPLTVNGGQSFTNKVPLVLTEVAQVTGSLDNPGAPLGSIGQIGDYAVVAVSNLNTFWYRNARGNWVEVGSDGWKNSWPTVKANTANPTLVAGTFIINETQVNVDAGMTMTALATAINNLNINGILAGVEDNRLVIFSDGSVSGPDSTLSGSVTLSKGADGAALVAMGILSSTQSTQTYYTPALHIAKHTQVPAFKLTDTNPRPTGSVWIKTTEPNAGARWRVKLWNTETRLWETIEAPIYPTAQQAIFELDRVGGGQNLAIGALFIQSNVAGDINPLGSFKIYRRNSVGSTTIRSGIIASTGIPDSTTIGATGYDLVISATTPGTNAFSTPTTITILNTSLSQNASDASIVAQAITSAGIPFVTAEVDSANRVLIRHTRGGEIKLKEGTTPNAGIFTQLNIRPYVDANSGTLNVFYEPGTDNITSPQEYRVSNWRPLVYTASPDAPTTLAENGTLWYNSIVDEVDLLVHNGTTWVGYQFAGGAGIDASPFYNATPGERTSPNGPIISATQPIKQSDGTDLVTGDLWIDTSDLENYPTIYRYRQVTDRWELLDTSDQTTENGVLFADARYSLTGESSAKADIVDLLGSAYIDPDCPDPALYPKGMLLWNLRRSGFNVKKFVRNYIDTGAKNTRLSDADMRNYYPHRWVTESGNQNDGSGSFGRKAQRKVVLQAMQAVINNNDDIRDDDSRIFNLLAAPGYPELIGEMVALNFDRGLSGFIVGDTPARLQSNATALNEWATNVNKAVEDNDDGLTTRDEYLAVFYPWGFTSDTFGNNVVVPPSHMMLRTIALSDNVSKPWFAPAGTRRGGITNASSTGYINSEGEFVSVTLNEGQRDTLYSNAVNPITVISGAGLVNYGQKTRARNASSLDRINVARLVVYLRSQLSLLAKPYIFEPNDKITRDEIKGAVESLLLELVGQRAIYDYLVVCDESNNTPNRIDRNELYVDVAIEPVKAIEFIYIPLRLKNTGEIASL
jgi:hypothetical protein